MHFPSDAGEAERWLLIIIIINDVQNLVSTCLYKHQIISSVPALKLPRALPFLLFSQPCSSCPSTWAPHKGMASFGSPHCVLEALLAAKLHYELGKIKCFLYFQLIFVFPCVLQTCKAMPSTRLHETDCILFKRCVCLSLNIQILSCYRAREQWE